MRRICHHENVGRDLFVHWSSTCNCIRTCQKEKWLFGPGVGADADRRPITADMTDEQMGAANEHDTRWSKKTCMRT